MATIANLDESTTIKVQLSLNKVGAMRKRLLFIHVSLPIFILISGCTKNAQVFSFRNQPTIATPEPVVTVLLSYYGDCDQFGDTTCFEAFDSPAWDKDLSPDREEDLASCVFDGIQSVIPSAVFLPPREGRIRLLGAENAAPPPVTVESTLPLVSATNPPGQSRGYIVLVHMSTKAVDKRMDFQASGYMWAIGREWSRETFCSVDIIDAASTRVAGKVSSSVSGKSGWGLPFLLIFPLPPIPWYAGTENKACWALGEAVGNFLNGVDLPQEIK